jgi:hypothetical protein
MLSLATCQCDFFLQFESDDVLFEIYRIEWVFDTFAKYLFDFVQWYVLVYESKILQKDLLFDW